MVRVRVKVRVRVRVRVRLSLSPSPSLTGKPAAQWTLMFSATWTARTAKLAKAWVRARHC